MIDKTQNNPKIPVIINCALTLLREEGDNGMTMRKVAAKAGMSLSNLQFYFKTKGDLLKGMVDYYFGICLDALHDMLAQSNNLTPQEKVAKFITFGLGKSGEHCELCIIFREFWAISSRNEGIAQHLQSYYREYVRLLTDEFSQMTLKPEKAGKIVSFLLPFFEGYSNTASLLPLDKKNTADMLFSAVWQLMTDDSLPETGKK